MFGLSIFEIIFLAGLALIVIGPKELPQVARTLGRFLNDLKRTTSGFTEELKQQARIDRIDLNEAPKKPQAHGFAESSEEQPELPVQVVPEQMELSEQEQVKVPAHDSSSSENKKS